MESSLAPSKDRNIKVVITASMYHKQTQSLVDGISNHHYLQD